MIWQRLVPLALIWFVFVALGWFVIAPAWHHRTARRGHIYHARPRPCRFRESGE